jgi:hypothetical protein
VKKHGGTGKQEKKSSENRKRIPTNGKNEKCRKIHDFVWVL